MNPTKIAELTPGGIRKVIALVSWLEIEALAAETRDPGEQVMTLKLLMSDKKPETIGDLFHKRESLIGQPLAHYSAPNRLVQRLTADEWSKILDPRLGQLEYVRRPWTGEFNLLPFGDPDAIKTVAEITSSWREVVYEGVHYRSTLGDLGDFQYRQIEDLVC